VQVGRSIPLCTGAIASSRQIVDSSALTRRWSDGPGLATTHRLGRVMSESKLAKNTERHDSMSGASHRT